MKKINRKIVLAVMYASVALFTTGCTSKDEVIPDKNSATVIGKKQNNGTLDTKITEAKTIKDNNIQNKLSYINVVTNNVNNTDVSLSSVHFAFDKYNLSDEMRVITKTNYKIISNLITTNNDLKIKLEGNCDEWGTDEYNYALGLKRAKIVKDTLINDGISEDKILIVTFGESNPLCSDKSENCWKKNRRTDYKLLP